LGGKIILPTSYKDENGVLRAVTAIASPISPDSSPTSVSGTNGFALNDKITHIYWYEKDIDGNDFPL
jgi:hypothetical protein